MAVYNRLYGQSNFDVCLQLYGSLDLLVKLCKDSSIEDINTPADTYIYDINLVKDIRITGYPYATQQITTLSDVGIFESQFDYTFE